MSISMTEKVYMRELTEQEMTEIYQSHLVEDFPAGEVKPLAHMLEGRKKGQYEAYGLFEKDTLKGYAYFIKNSTHGCTAGLFCDCPGAAECRLRFTVFKEITGNVHRTAKTADSGSGKPGL